MADENTIFAQQYGDNIMQLAQQKTSKLYNKVWLKTGVAGKSFYQDQIGQWGMQKKAGRNSDTPLNDPNLARRRVNMSDYEDGHLLDKEDQLKTISNPKSAYTIAGGASIGRQYDDIIIEAGFGTALSGEEGGTSVPFPAGQLIVDGGTGLTQTKVLETKLLFDNNDVPAEDRIFVTSPEGLSDMLAITTVTSSDYNTIKALVNGELNTWLGFEWIMSTRLPVASDIRSCMAFHKHGICMGTADEATIRTDERRDKSYAWQLYYSLHAGASRMEEVRVVKINIDESV